MRAADLPVVLEPRARARECVCESERDRECARVVAGALEQHASVSRLTAVMSKLEQILILDPPSDLRFRGKPVCQSLTSGRCSRTGSRRPPGPGCARVRMPTSLPRLQFNATPGDSQAAGEGKRI